MRGGGTEKVDERKVGNEIGVKEGRLERGLKMAD